MDVIIFSKRDEVEMEIKSVFITGATGFIGAILTEKMAKSGVMVKALYRTKSKLPEWHANYSNLEWVQGGINDEHILTGFMAGCDGVFHLAAYANLWAKDMSIFDDVNVKGTQNILNAALKSSVKKVVLTSTAGVLGPSTHGVVHEGVIRKVDFFSHYERTKHKAEKYVQESDFNDMDVVIVNPTRVYGPGNLSVSNGVTRMILQYDQGKFRFLPGKGDKLGNYVYVSDVVDGHILVMNKGQHKERYILGGENLSLAQLFVHLKEISGKDYRLYNMPEGLLKAASKFMLWRAENFGTPPMITPDWAKRFLDYHWEVSSEKAEKQLGYKITPFKQGLSQTYEWIKQM